MNNIIYGFILTSLAGLSTIIGALLIFFKNNDKTIIRSLSFAAGVMITISLSDLIPESYRLITDELNIFPTIIYILIFITIGIIISMLIDKYISIQTDQNLYKIGLISMLAIILHNIPEGIATFVTSTSNAKLGLSLAIAIALHNIPEGISISIPIYYAIKSRGKALLYTFISAISEPFGALLAFIFFQNYISNQVMGFLFSIIAGIMIQISIYELIPGAIKYKDKKTLIIWFIIGALFMILNHFIF